LSAYQSGTIPPSALYNYVVNSQELENDLLRKKALSFEDRLAACERNERDKEEEFAKNRRLVKLVEKYKVELNEAHNEIRDLKARLSHCSELQVCLVSLF
jgi:hypothetical protein